MVATNSPPLRIGCGAGFSGDRWDAAIPVVETLRASGGPAVLMFETLAERTLALAQLRRRQQRDAGFEPSLVRFLRPVLRACIEAGIPIVGNFGAANPAAAAAEVQRLARDLGLGSLHVGVVHGDDLLDSRGAPAQVREFLPASTRDKQLVSANVYLGAEEIAEALRNGAQVVVTGRVADPSLALGPMLAHFNWAMDDWDRLASGTMAGHLLECGAQVCGGYFADPGRKDVPGLADVGFPVIEMSHSGDFVVTKANATGGCVNRRTVTEQLLYEVHDPATYLTPDVIADITDAEVEELGRDRVLVRKVRGHRRPQTLKATVCYEGGWLAEGEISYAGHNAPARAALAARIVGARLQKIGLGALQIRHDLIGMGSVFADDAGRWWEQDLRAPEIQDVRMRVAIGAPTREDAEAAVQEVIALYTCGPAGGGGVRTNITPRLASDSCFVPRGAVEAYWEFHR